MMQIPDFSHPQRLREASSLKLKGHIEAKEHTSCVVKIGRPKNTSPDKSDRGWKNKHKSVVNKCVANETFCKMPLRRQPQRNLL
jgi:hypothetical protein